MSLTAHFLFSISTSFYIIIIILFSYIFLTRDITSLWQYTFYFPFQFLLHKSHSEAAWTIKLLAKFWGSWASFDWLECQQKAMIIIMIITHCKFGNFSKGDITAKQRCINSSIKQNNFIAKEKTFFKDFISHIENQFLELFPSLLFFD